ncbi:MAG: hypothetical protein A2046_14090 [Bacteroidetes bacterium GWA2_30_7]|nr:MAG: hypothetical protein A2046_14090 [Bacteroidetes bacterium GWA2_30_7]
MLRLFFFTFIFIPFLSIAIELKSDTLTIVKLISESEKYLVNDADTAIIILKNAMSASREINYNQGYINSGFLLAKAYKHKGLYYEALKTVDYLLKFSETHKDKELKGKCLYTIGEINRAAFYINKSINVLFDALTIFKELKNMEEQAKCYNRIAAAYFEKKDLKQAEIYADSSNLIAFRLNKASLISNNEEILGAVYRRTKKLKKAINKLESALHWIYISGDTSDVPNIFINFAYTYFDMNDIDKAFEYAKWSFKMSEKTDILAYRLNAAQILSDCYRANNQLEKAHNYLRYRDSLEYKVLMNDHSKIIMDLNEKYEAGKKEKERILLQNENEIKSVTIKNQKYLFLISIIVLFVVTIGAVIIYIGRRKLGIANERLEINKNKISQQHLQISEAYDKLKELESFKEDLTSMIVHDLKNPLNSIINPPSIYQGNKLQNFIRQTGFQMLTLVSNILDIQKHEDSKLGLSLESLNLNETIEENIDKVQFLYEQKNLKIENNIGNIILIKADADIFVRVIINLLTNAIKFSPNNGTIKIISEPINDFVKISVSDDGEGIPSEMHEVIFSKFGQVISKKSGIARSTGLGLAFCKIAVEAHGGKIGLISSAGKGSTFWITIPKSESVEIKKMQFNYYVKSDDYLLSTEELQQNIIQIENLKNLDICEVSKIKSVLKNINCSSNSNIQNWKNKLEQAVYSGNEEFYQHLLKANDK